MARKQREFNGKIFSDDGSGKLYNAELKKYLIYRPYPLMVDQVSESYVEPDNKQEYTSKELKNKFGTDNTDIINTGKEVEERVSKKIEEESEKKDSVLKSASDEIADYLYDETGRDKIAQSEIDDYINNDFLNNELSDYQPEKEEYEEVYKELEKRGYEIDYDKMSQEGLDDVARSELSDEEYSLYEKTKPSDDPYGVKSMLTEDLEQTEYDFTEESLNNPERKAVEEELVKRYEEEGDKVKYSQSFHLESPVKDIDEAQDYLSRDDMTQYVPDELKEVITKAEWVLDDEESGNINIETTRQLTQYEQAILSDWISGQNSDGLGEGFEQQDFAEGYYDPDTGEGPYTYQEVMDIVSRNFDNMELDDYVDEIDHEDIREALESYVRDGNYNYSFEDYLRDNIEGIETEEDREKFERELENTPEEELFSQYSDEYEDWLDEEEDDFINSGYLEEYLSPEAIDNAKDTVAQNDPRYNENLWEDSMSSIKSDRPGFRSEFIKEEESNEDIISNKEFNQASQIDDDLERAILMQVSDDVGKTLNDDDIRFRAENYIRHNYNGNATDEEIYEKLKNEYKNRGWYEENTSGYKEGDKVMFHGYETTILQVKNDPRWGPDYLIRGEEGNIWTDGSHFDRVESDTSNRNDSNGFGDDIYETTNRTIDKLKSADKYSSIDIQGPGNYHISKYDDGEIQISSSHPYDLSDYSFAKWSNMNNAFSIYDDNGKLVTVVKTIEEAVEEMKKIDDKIKTKIDRT